MWPTRAVPARAHASVGAVPRALLMSVFLVPLGMILLTARLRDARLGLRLTVAVTLAWDVVYVWLVAYYFPRIAP